MEITDIKKPPLGLIPRKIHDLNRLKAITDAIDRYITAGMTIPDAWIAEQVELIRRYWGGMKDGE